MTVVSDSSPLISLAKIESFHLLQQLYGSLTITADVYAEVVIAGAGFPGSSETSSSAWIQVKQIKRPDDLTARRTVRPRYRRTQHAHSGEGTWSRPGLLDDLRARKLAQREGFRVQGSVAVLEACFRKGFLIDLRGAYEQLLKRGVFLNRDLLNRSLQSLRLPPI